MDPAEIINAVYAEARSKLLPEVEAMLTFRPPFLLDKGQVQRWLGVMYGQQTRKVWYAKGGYYSVRVGPDPSAQRSVGGVGFGFYPDQKQCGSGKHAAALYEIAEKFCSTHRGCHHSPRGGKWFGFGYDYSGLTKGDFPAQRAADDLVEIIIRTFPAIDALEV